MPGASALCLTSVRLIYSHPFMEPIALESRTPPLAYSKTRPRGPYCRSGYIFTLRFKASFVNRLYSYAIYINEGFVRFPVSSPPWNVTAQVMLASPLLV